MGAGACGGAGRAAREVPPLVGWRYRRDGAWEGQSARSDGASQLRFLAEWEVVHEPEPEPEPEPENVLEPELEPEPVAEELLEEEADVEAEADADAAELLMTMRWAE